MFHVKRRRLFALWQPLCPSALPLRQHFALSIGAVQALFISDLLFALAIQSPSTPNRRMRLSDARRINLRTRQLLCPQERLITHFSAAPPLLTSQSRSPHALCARTSPKLNRSIGQSARRHSHMRRPHQSRPNKNQSRRLVAAKHSVRSGYFPPQPKANATPFPQVASLTCHVSIAYGYNVIINRSSFSLSQSFSIPSSSFLLGNLLLRRLRDQSLCLLTASRLSFGNKICLSARQSSPRTHVAFVFLSLPPLFPPAVQESAFPVAFVSCGTKAMPSAKTSTFIRLFDCLCIFMQHLFRSLLPFIIARCRVPLFGFVTSQTLASRLNERI